MKRIARDGHVAEWLERGAKLMAPKSTKSSADSSRKAWTYETGRECSSRRSAPRVERLFPQW
jgi:hypothetical protein